MSLLSVLKTIGKDLGHVAQWIEDAVKIAKPIAVAVDPKLGPIVMGVESVLDDIAATSGKPFTADTVQAVVQAFTTLQMIAPSALNPAVVAKIEAAIAAVPTALAAAQQTNATGASTTGASTIKA